MTDEIISTKYQELRYTNDIEAILDLARTVGMLQNYINDETAHGIARLMSTVLKKTNAIMSTDFVDVLERAIQDPQLDKALIDRIKFGITGFSEKWEMKTFKGWDNIELLKAMGRATKDT
jgi:hypothetical protein